jgi:hypothetical protein
VNGISPGSATASRKRTSKDSVDDAATRPRPRKAAKSAEPPARHAPAKPAGARGKRGKKVEEGVLVDLANPGHVTVSPGAMQAAAIWNVTHVRVQKAFVVPEDVYQMVPPEQAPLLDPSTATPIEVSRSEWATQHVRTYQEEAVAAVCKESGVVLLPCGAGKTMVGALTIVAVGKRTLIVCNNDVAMLQWKNELMRCTSLEEEQVGFYSSTYGKEAETVPDVLVTTYSMIATSRSDTKKSLAQRMRTIFQTVWGLVVLDEVHGMPAQTHEAACARICCATMLGLTATLVREDGKVGLTERTVGKCVFELTYENLVGDGGIVPVQVICHSVPWCSPLDELMCTEGSAAQTASATVLAAWRRLFPPSAAASIPYEARRLLSTVNKIQV